MMHQSMRGSERRPIQFGGTLQDLTLRPNGRDSLICAPNTVTIYMEAYQVYLYSNSMTGTFQIQSKAVCDNLEDKSKFRNLRQ